MYSWSLNRFINLNIPASKALPKTLAWLKVCGSQIYYVYGLFIAYRNTVLYALQHNSQVMYLEKFLNDKFNPDDRAIYIENIDNYKLFIYRHAEENPRVYLYRKYNPATSYLVGQFAAYGSFVYRCKSASSGNLPTNTIYWEVYSARPIIKRKSEYISDYDFIVFVPSSLVFDVNMMKSNINYYKYAGMRYIIQTY